MPDLSHEQRTADEVLTDTILFLCLMDRFVEFGDRGNWVGDRIKVQKATFLAAHAMWERKDKGFNLTFFRYDFGPLSKQLYAVWSVLRGPSVECWFEEEEFGITERGRDLAQSFCEEVLSVGENKRYLAVLEDVAKRYTHKTSYDIQCHVYEMRVLPIGLQEEMTVEKTPRGYQFTQALDPHEAVSQLRVEPGWLETLAIIFNVKASASLARAEADFAAGRVRMDVSSSL